jgi:prophage regulatory protein
MATTAHPTNARYPSAGRVLTSVAILNSPFAVFPFMSFNTDALLRISTVLNLIPVSRSGWYRGIRLGIYPAPIKMGRKVAFWRASDIAALIANLGKQQ